MSALEELSGAIRAVNDAAGSAVVGIGRGIRGSGVVIGDGRVLTNAHNLRGDEVTVTFRDGRSTRGTVRGVDPDGDLAVDRRRHDRRDGRSAGPTPSPVSATSSSALAATGAGAARVTAGSSPPSSRRSAGPAAAGSAAASSTPRRWPRARRAGRSSTAAGRLVALNTNRVGEGFYLARPADAALRERVDALGRGESRRAGRGSGSRSRRRTSPGGSAARSA